MGLASARHLNILFYDMWLCSISPSTVGGPGFFCQHLIPKIVFRTTYGSIYPDFGFRVFIPQRCMPHAHTHNFQLTQNHAMPCSMPMVSVKCRGVFMLWIQQFRWYTRKAVTSTYDTDGASLGAKGEWKNGTGNGLSEIYL